MSSNAQICLASYASIVTMLFVGCGNRDANRVRIKDTESLFESILNPKAVGYSPEFAAFHRLQYTKALRELRLMKSESELRTPRAVMAQLMIDPENDGQCKVMLSWLEEPDTVTGVSFAHADGTILLDGRISIQPFNSTFLSGKGSTLYYEGIAVFPLTDRKGAAVDTSAKVNATRICELTAHSEFDITNDLLISLVMKDGSRSDPFPMFIDQSVLGEAVGPAEEVGNSKAPSTVQKDEP